MLIEELRQRAVSQTLPEFDARNHADLYRAQPKERRRIVNALVRAGGEVEYARLLSDTGCSLESLRILGDLGLITALPSVQAPDVVVLPLERLFATPLIENEPDKLVEGLKMYPREVLWSIASIAEVPMDGADECTLRARLFHHALSRKSWDLTNDALRLFDVFRKRQWIQEADPVFRSLGRKPEQGARSPETLFKTFGKGHALGDLLLRMLLIPVRISPGAGFYRAIAVPRELRTAARELPPPAPEPDPERARPVPPVGRRHEAPKPAPEKPKPASDCVKDRKVELTSREGRLPGDLAKFLLLVEQEPPSITQRGTMNRRDLNRLAKRGEISEEDVSNLGMASACLRAVMVREGIAHVSSPAEELLRLSAADLARRFLAALPSIKFEVPYVWLYDEQYERLTDLARSTLKSRLKETGTIVCAHCLVEKLAASTALKKELRSPVAPADQVARKLVNALGDMYHFAGLVEAAFDRKGVSTLRLTPTGEAALGGPVKDPIPAGAAPRDEALIVQPSGEIIAPRSLPFDELRRLARSCDIKGVDAVAVFALNRKSLLRAAQRGEDTEALRGLIATRSKAPVPQTVRVLLDEIAARTGEIEIVPCSAVVRLKDPAMARELGAGVTSLPEGLVLLPPDAEPEKVAAELRKKGYLPRMKEGENPQGDESPGEERGGTVTDIDEIFHCLDEAEGAGAPVNLRLNDGRVLLGNVSWLDGDFVEVTPIFGGRRQKVNIFDIHSARMSGME